MKKVLRKESENTVNWTTELDIILIENSSKSMDELINVLQLSSDDIIERKRVLGLLRRSRQMDRNDK